MPFADICLEDRENCPNEWPFLHFNQDTCSSQTVELRDRHGYPIPLDNRRVCLLAKESVDAPRLYLNHEATVTGDIGVVEVSLTRQDLPMPGLFVGEFVVLEGEQANSSSEEGASSEEGSSSSEEDEPTCNIIHRIRCYVEVMENLQHSNHLTYRTLTVAEIRLAIRDKCREDNFLLDNVEFSDTEIAWALQRPIEYWNEIPPPLRPSYNTTNFPYRYHWTLGVIGELLSIASLNYERNRLKYSAAGLAVDDKDKSANYAKASDKFRGEYQSWVRQKKYAINMSQAFGSVSIASFGNTGLSRY